MVDPGRTGFDPSALRKNRNTEARQSPFHEVFLRSCSLLVTVLVAALSLLDFKLLACPYFEAAHPKMSEDTAETKSNKRSRTDEDGNILSLLFSMPLLTMQQTPRPTMTWDLNFPLLRLLRRNGASSPTKSYISLLFLPQRDIRSP